MELIVVQCLVKIGSLGQWGLTVSRNSSSLGSRCRRRGSGLCLSALLQLVLLLARHVKVLGELLSGQNRDYAENLLGHLLGSALDILVEHKVQRGGGRLEQLGEELDAVLLPLLGQGSLIVLNLELLVSSNNVVSLGESVGNRLPQSSRLGGGLLGDRSHLGRVQGGIVNVKEHGLLAGLEVLELNLLVPLAVHVVERLAGRDTLDLALKGVVGAGNKSLGLEVEIKGEIGGGTLDDRVVAVLVLEPAKENSSAVGVGRGDLVLLGVALGINVVQELENGGSLHQRSSRVTQEPRLGCQSTVHPDVVFRNHVKVGRLGRVVGGLLGNVVAVRAVVEVPVAGEELAENGVQRLLDGLGRDVPSGMVPLDHLDEPQNGVLGGVGLNDICGVLQRVCDALEHGLTLENEGGQRDSRQVSAWTQLRDNSHDDVLAFTVELVHVFDVCGRVEGPSRRDGAGTRNRLCLGTGAFLSACVSKW